MGQLLQILVGTFDLILIDTPPITSSNGVAVLASYFDGIVFIVRASSTSYHASKNALKTLKKVNANPIGAILTRTRE
jgi:Mrp family chromosome partitioning ATPase